MTGRDERPVEEAGETRNTGVSGRIDETPEPANQDPRPDEAGNTPLPEPDVDARTILGTVRTEPDVPQAPR